MGPANLDIPHSAESDAEGFEILRVWIAHRRQHVTIKMGVWDDPTMWGMMLADLAQHIAIAFEQDEGREIQETLRLIRDGFQMEMSHPTADLTSQ